MIQHLLWLYFSYFLFAIPAIVLLEAGQTNWGLVALVGIPAVRIGRRFDERKGYFIGGHSGSIQHSRAAAPDLLITRRTRPLLFRAFLLIELAIVLFLLWSVATRAGAL